MARDKTPFPQTKRTEITSEYDVGTMWKSMAFPRQDRTTLHIHCLDHDTMQDMPGSFVSVDSSDPAISEGFRRDLSSLSVFTDGYLVSWGGMGGEGSGSHSYVTDALEPLFREGDLADPKFRTGRSVTVAVPLENKTDDIGKDIPAHHILLSSHSHSSTRVQKYLMNSSVNDNKTVVCLMFNGGSQVLKMVCYALEHDIPVIVVKGSGGLADFICDLVSDTSTDLTLSAIRTKLKAHVESSSNQDIEILRKVHGSFRSRLTFYQPSQIESKPLDLVILDALLKCGKLKEVEKYLQTLQKRSTDREDVSEDRSESFIEAKASRLKVLLDSLVDRHPSASAVLVRHLSVNYDDVTLDQLMTVYSKSPERRHVNRQKMHVIGNVIINIIFDSCCDNDSSDVQLGKRRDAGEGVGRYRKARDDIHRYTKRLMVTPLRCPGHSECENCREIVKETGDTVKAGTCLPPAQELFLWSLFFGNRDLTEALIEHVQGKIAASLLAFAVFTGMENEETENALDQTLQAEYDQLQSLRPHAKHFEELATRCLRTCYEKDYDQTLELLVTPFDEWGNFSPLQMAVVTESMTFVAQDGCKAQLDKIWNGSMIGESTFVSTSTELSCRDDIVRIFTPVFAYWLGLVFQLLFLVLFSYVLLFDLQTTATPWFIVLAVYVADIAVDEIRQLLMDNPVLGTGCTCNMKRKVRGFMSLSWNFLDIIVIVCFCLGMLVFVDNEIVHAFGRVFLCLDALFFFLRFLQMLLYFKNLGVFLVMAQRSLKDTGYFMVILLTVMWGYLVASHGVLFPPPNKITSTWTYILDLPFKAYWQAFNMDQGTVSVCQEVTKQELEGGDCMKESILATTYGHYVASILLALYLMFINVLLMNLLIAKFNNTFREVYRQAKLHQSWQSCQLVLEYYTHTPAPFSTLSFVATAVVYLGVCCIVLVQCCCGNDSSNSDDDTSTEKQKSGQARRVNKFESAHMKKALERQDTETKEVRRSREMANIQQQLDQLRYGLQQVLKKVEAQSKEMHDLSATRL